MTTKKTVDPKQYCAYLRRPPKAEAEYKFGISGFFYICQFTDKPCIARNVLDTTDPDDFFPYSKPTINPDMLETCPARNVSKEVGKAILREIVERRKSELEGELEEKLSILD